MVTLWIISDKNYRVLGSETPTLICKSADQQVPSFMFMSPVPSCHFLIMAKGPTA
jgi:hypothetical protein